MSAETAEKSPALAASQSSWRCVQAHDREGWLALMADGLRGLQIPWETRLLSVVDAYDAMRSGRPYAAAIAHEEALERLILADHLFDADAVAALVATLGGTNAEKQAPRKALVPIS